MIDESDSNSNSYSDSCSTQRTLEGDRILWEDTTAMVINKPACLLTQAAQGIDSLERRVDHFLRARQSDSGVTTTRPYFAFPHRLDRPVSGAILVARNVRAARRFGEQFQSRKIGKTYWAVCSPVPMEDEGLWRDKLRKLPDLARGEVVSDDHPDGKEATLRFRVIERFVDRSGRTLGLVEIALETGRMHQIRLQFSHRGFPLMGDSTYGALGEFGPKVDDVREAMIALHSRAIEFHHPTTGVRRRVVAPVSKTWIDAFPEIGTILTAKAD